MSETIEDVVKSLRDLAEGRRKSGKLLQIDDKMFDLLADRIEAAHKRKVAVAENATTTPTCEKSSVVGNAAAMHETLLRCDAIAQLPEIREYKIVKEMRNLIWGVLALPPRNCDIYTMEEQSKRHEEYCKSHSINGWCVKCPLWQMRLLGINCAVAWVNLPSDALEDNKEVENEES